MIAAAANVTGESEFIVIGSQAILGSHESPPEAMLQSIEADLYPLGDPGAADLIDGALGDGSQFHLAFGYYAHGVGPQTAKAPSGWQERLVKREISPRPGSDRGMVVAWCLEVHDLVLSKCVAGRVRDWDYAKEAVHAGIVGQHLLLGRVADLPGDDHTRGHIERTIRAMLASSRSS